MAGWDIYSNCMEGRAVQDKEYTKPTLQLKKKEQTQADYVHDAETKKEWSSWQPRQSCDLLLTMSRQDLEEDASSMMPLC